MGFTVVPHKGGAFTHQLEVGTFPSDFIIPYVQGLFLMADEELWYSREVVDVLKDNILMFACVVFRFQDDGAYLLGLDEPPWCHISLGFLIVCRAQSRS